MKLTAPRDRCWLYGGLLVAAVIAAYQPAWHAGFIWDDDKYVTQNELLTASDGLKRIWFSLDSPSQYFPLVYTSFRLERALWGLNPAPYHWVNILLHAANALLVWRVLKRLSVPGAWLGAAIFALHPVQVESVAWITERKNVLTLFFSLLAILSWVNFTEGKKPPWLAYGTALLCYSLALFSKTTACTLPAAFLLILWLRGKPIGWRRVAQVVPFVLLGVAMGLVTIWWEQNHQGVKGKLAGIGMIDRVLIASRAVWFYLGKLIRPDNLSFNYPRWNINHSSPVEYLWLLAAIGAAAAIYFLKPPVRRSVAVAMSFYVITLGPLLGFFMLATFKYSFVADHYQYVASIGPIALVAAGITKALAAFEKQNVLMKPGVCGALLLVLGILASRQAVTYANLETLWRATAEKNPQSFIAHNNLAIELLAKGRVDEAIDHYRKALEIQPEALAAHNLANALFAKRQVDEAIVYYRKALELEPRAALIAYNLGNALSAKGQMDEAIEWYRKALEFQPNGPAIANTLGNALLTRGRVDDAIIYLSKAVELAPNLARAHNNLANALVRKGRLAEAIAHYDTTLNLQPTNVATLNNLSWILATCSDGAIRNGKRAVELAQRADELSGGNSPDVLVTLSAAYAEAGRFPEAIAAARRALNSPAVRSSTPATEAVQAKIKLYESQTPFRDASLNGRTKQPE